MKNQPGTIKNQLGTSKKQPKPLKTYKKPSAILDEPIWNLEKPLKLTLICRGWLWVVTGGYRRLPGGRAHFSWKTDRHFIIIYITSSSSTAQCRTSGGSPTPALSQFLPTACHSSFTGLSKWGDQHSCHHYTSLIEVNKISQHHLDLSSHHDVRRARKSILTGTHSTRVESSANGDIISIFNVQKNKIAVKNLMVTTVTRPGILCVTQ